MPPQYATPDPGRQPAAAMLATNSILRRRYFRCCPHLSFCFVFLCALFTFALRNLFLCPFY